MKYSKIKYLGLTGGVLASLILGSVSSIHDASLVRAADDTSASVATTPATSSATAPTTSKTTSTSVTSTATITLAPPTSETTSTAPVTTTPSASNLTIMDDFGQVTTDQPDVMGYSDSGLSQPTNVTVPQGTKMLVDTVAMNANRLPYAYHVVSGLGGAGDKLVSTWIPVVPTEFIYLSGPDFQTYTSFADYEAGLKAENTPASTGSTTPSTPTTPTTTPTAPTDNTSTLMPNLSGPNVTTSDTFGQIVTTAPAIIGYSDSGLTVPTNLTAPKGSTARVDEVAKDVSGQPYAYHVSIMGQTTGSNLAFTWVPASQVDFSYIYAPDGHAYTSNDELFNDQMKGLAEQAAQNGTATNPSASTTTTPTTNTNTTTSPSTSATTTPGTNTGTTSTTTTPSKPATSTTTTKPATKPATTPTKPAESTPDVTIYELSDLMLLLAENGGNYAVIQEPAKPAPKPVVQLKRTALPKGTAVYSGYEPIEIYSDANTSHATGRTLQTSIGEWAAFDTAMDQSGHITAYELGHDQWVKAADLHLSEPLHGTFDTTAGTALYSSDGTRTGAIKATGPYKVFAVRYIDGHQAVKLGTDDQWIMASAGAYYPA